jgi:hypothetical protein
MTHPDDIADHHTSIALWDLTSPVVAGRRGTVNVGVACSCGCDLTGRILDIHSETGTKVGGGTLGAIPWPGTTALYWANLELAAPLTAGAHSWTIQATAGDQVHEHATFSFTFVVVGLPEHRVTVRVVDKETGVPLDAVELRIGMFRATTDERGIAEIEVSSGSYDVTAWKIGREMLSRSVHVTADASIHLEMAVALDPEQPYWM